MLSLVAVLLSYASFHAQFIYTRDHVTVTATTSERDYSERPHRCAVAIVSNGGTSTVTIVNMSEVISQPTAREPQKSWGGAPGKPPQRPHPDLPLILEPKRSATVCVPHNLPLPSPQSLDWAFDTKNRIFFGLLINTLTADGSMHTAIVPTRWESRTPDKQRWYSGHGSIVSIDALRGGYVPAPGLLVPPPEGW